MSTLTARLGYNLMFFVASFDFILLGCYLPAKCLELAWKKTWLPILPEDRFAENTMAVLFSILNMTIQMFFPRSCMNLSRCVESDLKYLTTLMGLVAVAALVIVAVKHRELQKYGKWKVVYR